MGWLERLRGGKGQDGKPQDRLDPADVADLRQDIDTLDKVLPGLAEAVLRYVTLGENDSILLTLEKNAQAVAKALRRDSIGWSTGGNWVKGRSDFILRPRAWRPDVLRRYGQLLAIGRESQFLPLPGTPKSPAWFRVVLAEYSEACAASQSQVAGIRGEAPPFDMVEAFTVAKLEDLLAVAGDEPAAILDCAFERTEGWLSTYVERASPESMPDFDTFLRRDPPARCAEIAKLSAKGRGYALRALARRGLVDGPWFDLAFAQASDTSKTVREAALVLLRAADSEWLLARVEAAFGASKAAQKVELARAAAAVGGGSAISLLQRLASAETNATVIAEMQRLIDQDDHVARRGTQRPDGPEGYSAVDGTYVEAPPDQPLPPDTPLSPALRALIAEAFDIWREESLRLNREIEGQKQAYRRPVPPVDAAVRLCARLEPGGERLAPPDPLSMGLFSWWGLSKDRAALQARIVNDPDFTLWRWLRYIAPPGEAHGLHTRAGAVFGHFGHGPLVKARTGGDLRLYADACAVLGDPPDAAIRTLLHRSYYAVDLDGWAPEGLWPYVARHFQLIDEALGLAPPSEQMPLDETRALELLSQFPKTPARYFLALVERAVGDRKTMRRPARDLLAAAPGLESLLIPLLENPIQEVRAGAASWLAERGAQEALPPLQAAAKAEKLPAAKAALLSAIARLGGDISAFVSAGALLAEAQNGLAKTTDKALDWFPFSAMPALRQKSGEALDPQVVRWWLVLAAKLKQPGGNPWFDLLLDQLEPASAARLGAAVLQAWIAYDSVRPSDAEANTHAQAHVDAQLKAWQRYDETMTYERVFAMLRSVKLGEYRNSGNDSKGLLALAVRISGADAVAMVKGYFRDHYPRTAQCKALLECLAANPSPAATQYVLSIAKRWRTRSVQELAATLVQAIADRRGWSADQLADRTVPTAGFDEAGVLRLPIGEREYTGRLDPQWRILLYNPEGKPVQGLPAAAAGDKDEALAAAKATLSAARKEAKQVLDFQRQRLYEALCQGRVWPMPEWSEHLLRHPLVGRLVQHLVWVGLDGEGRALTTFRPMEDLSLTGADDAPVAPDGLAAVRLAHRAGLSDAEAAAWRAHLKDYEITPLFDQLDRPVLRLGSAEADAREIVDRKGWMIEAFKLRGAAAKLGYARGPAEDGGVFMTYEKRFPGLKLAAVIEFTGNGLPEENRLGALIDLTFQPFGKSGGLRRDKALRLKDAPPVLLSEAWNDLHAIAAAGTGFDPEWEKKASW